MNVLLVLFNTYVFRLCHSREDFCVDICLELGEFHEDGDNAETSRS